MKKNKKHKWKYQINIKKKILVTVILGVILFVGVGFAMLETNLGILGTLEVGKYERTLYGALRKNASSGYALKYTGTHQDSMDQSVSTKDIYYFKANNSQEATAIANVNNVVFANYCWQAIRTTDTGGVKLLYNGIPDIVETNGNISYDCSDTRNSGLKSFGPLLSTYETDLEGTYLYASSYTSVSGKYHLENPQSITIDSSNADEKIADIIENYPYTCLSNTNECYTASKIGVQSTGTKVYTYLSTGIDSIGSSPMYNQTYSPVYVGYMHGTDYSRTSVSVTNSSSFPTSSENFDINSVVFSSMYYSDSYDWNTTTPNKYTLINPQQVTTDTTAASLVGKYIANTDSGVDTLYYVVSPYAYNAKRVNVKSLTSGDTNISIRFSDDLTNSTTLGQNELVELKDYYTNYANYVGKYTCGDSSTSCSYPKLTVYTNNSGYGYLDNFDIVIAKNRNGLALDDYIQITSAQWYKGFDTTYADYKYTCGDTSTTCTSNNIRYIVKKENYRYEYAINRLYGSSVKYENNKYKLQNVQGMEAVSSAGELGNYHYTCLSATDTECNSVTYIYSKYYGITYSDPSITSVEDVLDEMLKGNSTESLVKQLVDKWYEAALKDTIYESKIDDTIFCNDRSFSTTSGKTFEESGWNPNGGLLGNSLRFRTTYTDLDCPNVSDRFSVTNNAAKLKYKIGLPTAAEMMLIGDQSLRARSYPRDNYYYWLMTPLSFDTQARVMVVGGAGEVQTVDSVDRINDVRPMISLKSGTIYSQGDGSKTNPYVVDLNN